VSIATNIEAVKERIAAAAGRSGRRGSDVLLVAVSKTFGVDAIRQARDAGVGDLGENRAQELRDKASQVSDVRWHFVGHLQTNKVRLVVGTAHLVHSIDRVELANAIDKRARSMGIVQDVLIEVNVSGEQAKHGVSPDHLPEVAEELAARGGVALRGLMTIPPLPDHAERSRQHFRRLAELGELVRGSEPRARELSMGMTRDLEVAVEEGATMVRVGEAIFGPRTL
jgi:PLP dependent protein